MRLCIPQLAFIALVIILGVSSMLTGCGKKGPLYLPEQQPKNAQQQS
jgi:predicted small lipoprotein YifL